MKIDELSAYGIPQEYLAKFREENITELYPPQAEVVKNKLFKERNVILSLPTASGKTLLATLAIINKLQSKSKIIYVAPLVALASEKYEYFKKIFSPKYKVALSVGDFDSSDPWLHEQDIIVVTSEKLDSLTRHNVKWIKDIRLLIVDEIHMLNDGSRGPTLEILVTKLRELSPHTQILGLSATIKNAKELAEWLNAVLFVSDFRPVKLYEGTTFDSKIHFYNKDGYSIDGEPEEGIALNTLGSKKQALFFVSTRKSAESLAEKLSATTQQHLDRKEQQQLNKIANEIESALESPTRQCKRIAQCVRHGVAFHHAGLLRKQKHLVEDNFRNGLIKFITATPTLAMGVNLPAWRVVIRDAKRYYPGIGSSYIPVLDYKQMIGRAGRPQYDSFGESILIGKSEEDAQDLSDRYIMGEPEEITSKLALEPILRTHVLALVASEFCKTRESLLDFFSKTFYSFHYGDTTAIEDNISYVVDMLCDWGFVKREKERLVPSIIGKRVSELYIDPLTAHDFISSLNMAASKDVNEFSILQTISNTLEMQPLVGVKSGEYEDIQAKIVEKSSSLLQDIPEEYDYEFENFFKSVKTTMLFEEWTNEATDEQLLTRYNIAPGEMRGKLQIADWLIYSLQELALLKQHKDAIKPIRKLRVRMMYGVKEELLPLVKLRGIGRVRARKLFNAGLKSLDDLRTVADERLSTTVGTKVAYQIKKQVGESRIKKKFASDIF